VTRRTSHSQFSCILVARPDDAELRMGRKVVEILPRHVSKGGVLKALMGLAAFDGQRPIMIGETRRINPPSNPQNSSGAMAFGSPENIFGPMTPISTRQPHVRQWLSRFVDGRGR
jgi:hypothetical protein